MLGVLKALLVQELLKLNREFQKFLRELSDIFYKNFLRTLNVAGRVHSTGCARGAGGREMRELGASSGIKRSRCLRPLAPRYGVFVFAARTCRRRVRCLLVLDSVTSTPQWICQPKPRDFSDMTLAPFLRLKSCDNYVSHTTNIAGCPGVKLYCCALLKLQSYHHHVRHIIIPLSYGRRFRL